MFTLPNTPSPRATKSEQADFIELLCWKKGRVSQSDLQSHFIRLSDNIDNNESEDDDNYVIEIMQETSWRCTICRDSYPFELDSNGLVLRLRNSETFGNRFYKFLLLCTRANMKNNRNHAEIDATLLMEEVSAQVLKNYLGNIRAETMVFGTAAGSSFPDRVNALCKKSGEGSGFQSTLSPLSVKDDKLDIVGWIPFSDGLSAKLSVFGQCKTGTNWRDEISQLQPKEFCKKWLSKDSFINDPVRAFCVAEALDRRSFIYNSYGAGLLFDRCRLVDYSQEMPEELSNRIHRWTEAAWQAVQGSF